MNNPISRIGPIGLGVYCLLTLFTTRPINSQTASNTAPLSTLNTIPAGTILPIVLHSTLPFEKCKPGQLLRGKISQDVPLPNGGKVHKGSTLEGQVIAVSSDANGVGSKVTIRFEKINVAGQWVPVVTNLRAIAGFMTVIDADTPQEAPNEGSPYNWLTKTQIGGDSVFGVGGPVVSFEDDSKLVGVSTSDGVLGHVSAKAGSKCRGVVDGNDTLQALWLFSGDACGAYGISHLRIVHAGRTDPKGTIVFASDTQKLSLKDGDGLLLRVD